MMFDPLTSAFMLAMSHPKVTLLIFVGAILLSFRIFAEPNGAAAWRGVWQLVGAIFSAPFRFLRDVVAMLLRYEEDERRYVGSREYLLWKLCQFEYLAIFGVSVLVLAGGMLGALYAMIPSERMAARTMLLEQVDQLRKDREDAKATVERLTSASAAADLRLAADVAERDVRQQDADVRNRREAIGGDPFGGYADAVARYLDRFRKPLTTTQETEAREALTGFFQQTDVLRDSPESQARFTAYFDARLRLLVARDVLQRRESELRDLKSSTDSAESRLRSVSAALGQAEERLGELTIPSLVASAISPERILSALGVLVMALAYIVALVWAGGIFIDVQAWLVMMMLALERRAQPKGTESDPPQQTSPGLFGV